MDASADDLLCAPAAATAAGLLMSDALTRMAAYLIQSPGWKPDRFAVQREKTCTRCHKKKSLEKFAYSASLCKACYVELTKQWKKNRSKR